jgi:predicted membrane-bound mannosyltransferase/DNA-binding beta-propeller fold protein YncE
LYNLIRLDWEKALYAALIILALCTRLAGLGDRVQSHDESIHTKYSWNLYTGHGFQHNPLMHGPFLFHVTALSYFLFGDTDFSARLPVALMGVALVAFPYLLRRWLGRAGALATSFFLLISPSIAYYSRYIRHDVPTMLWSLGVIFALFSYLRDGRKRWLFVMAGGVSLMFATKEVAFIYAAISGLFLIGLLVVHALERKWPREGLKTSFLTALALAIVGLLVLGLGLTLAFSQQKPTDLAQEELAQPVTLSWWAISGGMLAAVGLAAAAALLIAGHLPNENLQPPSLVIALIIVIVVTGIFFRLGMPVLLPRLSCIQQRFRGEELQHCTQQALQGFAWPEGRYVRGIYIDVRHVMMWLPFAGGLLVGFAWLAVTAFRHYRAFDLIITLGTLCLPLLSPLVIKLPNLDPIDYNSSAMYYSGAIALQMVLVSVAIGLTWDSRRQIDNGDPSTWLIAAAIYYVIFIILFTTVLTNGYGIPSGIVGSLGYWLKQQGVERGGQPQYYYVIMTLFYEYLPLLLTLLVPVYLFIRGIILPWRSRVGRLGDIPALKEHFIPFTLWWTVLSWIGYSIAGERMPWLTVHLALPMILLSGWLVGRLLDGIDWHSVFRRRTWLLALIAPPLVIAVVLLIRAIADPTARPFQGLELNQLQASGHLINGGLGVVVFGTAGFLVWRKSEWRVAVRVLLLIALLLPMLLTIRTAWRFCYVNAEYPTEFLVYAHAAPGVREAMEQIDELSRRIAGGSNLIKIAYGSDGSTLFYWQLRHYANAVFYGEKPSREQMDSPVIIAGRDQWDDVAPYLGDNYIVNTYTFLWWPMQDYFHLSKERIQRAITDTQMSAALWDIWYNRDYRRYDEVTGKNHTLDEWVLRNEFRLYVRRDVAAQMWNLGTTEPEPIASPIDPYAAGWQDLAARLVFGSAGAAPGQLQAPRGIAVGPEGFLYVADSDNHRIQKFTANGQFVAAWGSESNAEAEWGVTPGFFSPWDVAIGPDGAIYVADTWNYRIQKLDREGNLIIAWGSRGEGDSAGPSGFYGPRGIAVGPEQVYVADTGNKRIQAFGLDGVFAFEWGGGGVIEGYLDEPVGIAVDSSGMIYVADTWNQRVQVFDQNGHFVRQWPIDGWDIGHAEEKPYLAVDSNGFVYVTDPAHYRVLVFDNAGNYVRSFGQYGLDERSFALPMGIALGEDNTIYVADAHGNRILVFDPLKLGEPLESQEIQ